MWMGRASSKFDFSHAPTGIHIFNGITTTFLNRPNYSISVPHGTNGHSQDSNFLASRDQMLNWFQVPSASLMNDD